MGRRILVILVLVIGLIMTVFTAGAKSGFQSERMKRPLGVTDSTIYFPIIFRPLSSQIINGDFEGGELPWGQSSEQGWDLILKNPSGLLPHSGEWAAWLGGGPDEQAIITQTVKLSAAMPTLHFYYAIVSLEQQCDGTADSGGVVVNESVVVRAFTLCQGEQTGGWTEGTVNLSGYVGQTVSVGFMVVTDGSDTSSFYIDDVWLGN